MLLVNLAKNQNHWLGLRLIGTSSNRDAIGARATLQSAKRLWVDEVRSGSSYNSSSDLRLHFGLGAGTHLTNIQIRWPNGKLELFDPPATVDHLIELTEGTGHQQTAEQRAKQLLYNDSFSRLSGCVVDLPENSSLRCHLSSRTYR